MHGNTTQKRLVMKLNPHSSDRPNIVESDFCPPPKKQPNHSQIDHSTNAQYQH